MSGTLRPAAAQQTNVSLYSCGNPGLFWYNPTATGSEGLHGWSEDFGIINLDSQSYQIGLGFTITNMQSGMEINDTADNTVVNVAVDQTAPFTRSFVFPQGIATGWYSITCSIWLGQPGSGTWLDSLTQTRALYVGTDDPSLQPYTGNNFTPGKIAFDHSGNLGVTDESNGRFLEFSPPFNSRGLFPVFTGQLGSANLGSGWGGSTVTGPRPAWTFDACGNLWFVDTANSQILEFTPPFTDGMNPSRVIVAPILNYTAYETTAAAATFDSSGNLWVVDRANSRVLEFAPPFSNGMNPALVIGQPDFTSTGESLSQNGLSYPSDLAFDSSGNLWVLDSGDTSSPAGRVLEFTPPFSNGMNAAVVLGAPDFTSSPGGFGDWCLGEWCGPSYLAFDSSGNLWVDNSVFAEVWRFSPPFSNGMKASLDWVYPICDDCSGPQGISSDPSGNLWIATQAWGPTVGGDALLDFTPNHITSLPLPNNVANFAPTVAFSAFFSNVTQNASQIGPSAANCQSQPSSSTPQSVVSASNYTTYVALGAVAVVAVIAAIFLIRRRTPLPPPPPPEY